MSFTVATVWAGLRAAANFAALYGEMTLAERYRGVAEGLRQGTLRFLFDPELNRFIRRIYVRADGTTARDLTIDSSVYGLWYFGMFARRSADREHDEGGLRAALVQDRGRRHQSLRERLVLPGEPGHQQCPRQSVVHLHHVVRPVAGEPGALARRPQQGAREPGVGCGGRPPKRRALRAAGPLHQGAHLGLTADLEPCHGGVPGERVRPQAEDADGLGPRPDV